MISKNKQLKKGFTLIELLVVVLIVGILAAVALPQYKEAVEKTKASEAFILLKALAQAEKEYYIINGEYAKKFEDLTVDIKWTDNKAWQYALHTDTLSNKDWSLQLIFNHNAIAIQITRISGQYVGGGFKYLLFSSAYSSQINSIITDKIICQEGLNMTYYPFDKTEGSYCESIFNGTLINDNWNRIYLLY